MTSKNIYRNKNLHKNVTGKLYLSINNYVAY